MSALATILNRFAPVAGKRRIGLIGLECALHALHMVQLETGRDGRVGVRALASLSYPCPLDELLASPDQMKLLIKRALREQGFYGREVVTTLPSPDLQIMPVSYQVGQGESPEAALVAVMSERLDGEFADYVVDYTPVRSEERGGEQLAIVAVAKREAVINYLELLRKCGLHTEHLEVGPTAIRRLVTALADRNRHENVMAINFGRHSSYITVVSGARLLFDQAVQFNQENVGASLGSSQGAAGRYSVWPGQATAYMVGMLIILDERQRAMEQLGAAFDLKGFHRALLANGSVPLTVLDDIVDRYIADAQNP